MTTPITFTGSEISQIVAAHAWASDYVRGQGIHMLLVIKAQRAGQLDTSQVDALISTMSTLRSEYTARLEVLLSE